MENSSSRDLSHTAGSALDGELAAIRLCLLENVRYEIWKEVAYAFDLAVSRTPQLVGASSREEQ